MKNKLQLWIKIVYAIIYVSIFLSVATILLLYFGIMTDAGIAVVAWSLVPISILVYIRLKLKLDKQNKE